MVFVDIWKNIKIEFKIGSTGLEVDRLNCSNEVGKWEPEQMLNHYGFIVPISEPGYITPSWLNRSTYFKVFFMVLNGEVVKLDISTGNFQLYSIEQDIKNIAASCSNDFNESNTNKTYYSLNEISFSVNINKNPLETAPYTSRSLLTTSQQQFNAMDGLYLLRFDSAPFLNGNNNTIVLKKLKNKTGILKQYGIEIAKRPNKSNISSKYAINKNERKSFHSNLNNTSQNSSQNSNQPYFNPNITIKQIDENSSLYRDLVYEQTLKQFQAKEDEEREYNEYLKEAEAEKLELEKAETTQNKPSDWLSNDEFKKIVANMKK